MAGLQNVNPTILKTNIEALPILTEENFSTWKIRFTSLLKIGKIKEAVLEGNGNLSEDDNDLLCSIILSKLSSGTHANVVRSSNSENAMLLWKAIAEHFVSTEPSNRSRVFNVYASITFETGNPRKFITDTRFSMNQMEEVGIIMPPDILCYDLMRRLPSNLEVVKQRTTADKTNINVEHLLKEMEIYINEKKINSLTTSNGAPSGTTMYSTTQQERSTKCKTNWHNDQAPHPKERCWMLHPELRPEHFGGKAKPEVSSLSTHSLNNPDVLVLDSGSSSHMVSDKSMFFALDESEKGMINTSCGRNTLKIEGKGSITVVINKKPFTLNNVFYVPHLLVNLLSLRQLLLDSYQVDFQANSFSVSKDGVLLFGGNFQGNIPVVKFSYTDSKEFSHLCSSELLHKSLGHVSYSRIRKTLAIPVNAPEVCKSCAVVKITKSPFKKRREFTASRPFEELHLDLVGPITPESYQHHKYFVTIVDANTRYCAALPLTSKGSLFSILSEALDVEAKRFGYYPSIIHSDRGTEFTNQEMAKYCKEHVIRLRVSDPYTPQQNGLAERFNRTILESLRTTLHDSGLRKNLWSEILASTTLVLNQIPSKRNSKSPYERFKERKLPLTYFHPLGNPVTYLVLPPKTASKLLPKGDFGTLIGYQPELESYRILTSDNKLVDTKHVTFLDYQPSNSPHSSDEDLVISPVISEKIACNEKSYVEKEATQVKSEDKEDETTSEDPEDNEDESHETLDSDEDEEIAEQLTPALPVSSGRQLRERTLQVKPLKYSYLTLDPKSFIQAVRGPDNVEWKAAISKELENIEEHDVWMDHFGPAPSKSLATTWVFRTKPATASSEEKKKARLCIQGFMQVPGIDFEETFAPTGKFPTLLTLLVLAIDKKLPIKQFDVKSAFLFAPLEEEIFIKTPQGSHRSAPFLKLKKSLYGLKQAPKNWYNTLTSWFNKIDFMPSDSDACLFIHKKRTSFLFFHVDDLIVAGNIDDFEEKFLKRFPNSTAHTPDTLLGMDLTLEENRILLSQKALIQKGLDLLNLANGPSVQTPLTPAIQLCSVKETDEDHLDFLKLGINYRSFTGILNFLACRTRPDLAPAVSILSRFNHTPGLSHWKQVIHCWKYLKGTLDLKLQLQPSNHLKDHKINFYTDATWADDHETRISQSGSISFWKACPITWNSKKQKNITLSSTEAEMNALSDGEQENQWLASLVQELWNEELAPSLFHIDNQGLLEKLKNFGSNPKTKHLDIKIKDLRGKYHKKSIDVQLIRSEEMVADALTKAVSASSLQRLKDKIFACLAFINENTGYSATQDPFSNK